MSLKSTGSAGFRDSALTVQGVLQAERLGQHLAALETRYTHVFASDLQRAVKTAEALLAAEPQGSDSSAVTVQPKPDLREQNFGFYEGKPFYARQHESKKSGKDKHRSEHRKDANFQDVESKESMAARTTSFIDQYLKPLLVGESAEQQRAVAIVSHGILLSHLWRSILGMFGVNQTTVDIAPGVSIGNGGVTPLEYLGGWSNTGYLELDMTMISDEEEASPRSKIIVQTVNGKDHLKGLKRARGVGSSQYDEGQKKIESFFKKTKTA
ncbi:MAG: hypothetical protein L6R37_002899 [Teloschistes peruensis]|nr:MAG: hypothetical protein L6R37_002899 [Teloschistes peruensis]